MKPLWWITKTSKRERNFYHHPEPSFQNCFLKTMSQMKCLHLFNLLNVWIFGRVRRLVAPTLSTPHPDTHSTVCYNWSWFYVYVYVYIFVYMCICVYLCICVIYMCVVVCVEIYRNAHVYIYILYIYYVCVDINAKDKNAFRMFECLNRCLIDRDVAVHMLQPFFLSSPSSLLPDSFHFSNFKFQISNRCDRRGRAGFVRPLPPSDSTSGAFEHSNIWRFEGLKMMWIHLNVYMNIRTFGYSAGWIKSGSFPVSSVLIWV